MLFFVYSCAYIFCFVVVYRLNGRLLKDKALILSVNLRYQSACISCSLIPMSSVDIGCFAHYILNDRMRDWKNLTGLDPLDLDHFVGYALDMAKEARQ
jgi:hypothetical protein